MKMEKAAVERLWEELGGELRWGGRLTIVPGPAPVKGKPKKEVQIEMVIEIVKIAFTSGLSIGFERGFDAGCDAAAPISE